MMDFTEIQIGWQSGKTTISSGSIAKLKQRADLTADDMVQAPSSFCNALMRC
jgi:hypothetical protein